MRGWPEAHSQSSEFALYLLAARGLGRLNWSPQVGFFQEQIPDAECRTEQGEHWGRVSGK